MSDFPVRDLRNNTAVLVRKAQHGEDVVITVNGKPAARLVPISTREQRGITGSELLGMLDVIEADPSWSDELKALRAEVGSVGSWSDDDG